MSHRGSNYRSYGLVKFDYFLPDLFTNRCFYYPMCAAFPRNSKKQAISQILILKHSRFSYKQNRNRNPFHIYINIFISSIVRSCENLDNNVIF